MRSSEQDGPSLLAYVSMSDEDHLSLSQLRKRHVEQGYALPSAIEARLKVDPRQGAQAILDAVARRRRSNRAEGQRLRRLRRHEDALWRQGITHIAGVDEAGMSPLAGPVVAGAAILPQDFRLPGIDDSKKLSAQTRARMVPIIKQHAIAWAVGFVEPDEIDRINIYQAGLLAMRRAVEGLDCTPQHLLIDARPLKALPIPQTSIIHGDAESVSIAAASILAKTTRDAHMLELDTRYPGYGLAQHKGYPVRAHYEALARLGVTPCHRRSFAPVREAMGLRPEQQSLFANDHQLGEELA